ncbi:MAG: tetratricopeptide repeat protein [Anaerolineae bacterium]|nr:tetratricopeptide repeat protein [Anaerolineae bacterium]
MLQKPISPRLWFVTLIVTLSLILMVTTTLAQAVSPTEAMAAANQNYEAGNYIQAIEIYERIIEAGVEDSALYYNLGNAYFKEGDLGRAILNYRRADQLDPRDIDISANLRLARSQSLDKLDSTNDEGSINFVRVVENWLTIGEASVLALLLWLLLCALAIIAIVSRKFRQTSLWGMAIVGVFLLAGLISIGNRLYNAHYYPPAVIVAEKVDVMSGPGGADNYVVEFELHSGAEVTQLESRDNWRRVSLPGNDFQGWISASSIEPVTPN